ncbi:MAG TPA: ATP-grasp domain-containing protein, partial [Spirochaetia bacterium]|nr:ATP-grasp domain-containing protein [Spirochaetia bacterium]
MQLPAIRIAKRKGWFVHVADGNPACPGASIADSFLPIDLKDSERLLDAARSAEPRITGVFTAGTDFSANVARIGEALGLAGTSYESALNASDKARMRRCFAAAGVPSPRFVEFSQSDDPVVSPQGLTYPLVVKPVDNMGARGVRRVDSPDDLAAAVQSAIEFSRTQRAIVEEFIPGNEYSIDAIVYQGEITICGLAERHIYFPPAFVEMGHTIPAEIGVNVRRDLVEVFSAGVRALGITRGAAKGDVFHTGQGAVIGEIAARLSGGYMSGWTFPYASGLEVTEAAMNLAVGLPPGDLSPRRNWVTAERAFISVPGTVAQISGVAAARNIRGVKDVFLRIDTGTAVNFPANNVEKCGNVIACASDRTDAIRAAQYALRCIEIRLEPNIAETDQFLFSAEQEYDHALFGLFDAVNRGFYSELQARRPALDTVSSKLSGHKVEPAPLPDILPLPAWERETLPIWSGATLSDTVRTCLRRHGLSLAPKLPASQHISDIPESGALSVDFSALFWTALVRGGIQGVDYLIDSLGARMPFGVAAFTADPEQPVEV